MSNVCEHGQLRRVCLTCEQIEEIKALTRERDAWRRLVIEHNAMLDCCHRLKDDPCEGCPKQYSIAIPPELEQSS